MSNYITDGPFTPGNNSLICPNKQSQPTVSKNDETNVISYLQSLTNFCNEQLADRQEYLQKVNSNKTRATIFPSVLKAAGSSRGPITTRATNPTNRNSLHPKSNMSRFNQESQLHWHYYLSVTSFLLSKF